MSHPETEYDYHSAAAERRRRRAIESLNSKPGISPKLRKLILYAIVAAVSSKVLYEVVKWLVR